MKRTLVLAAVVTLGALGGCKKSSPSVASPAISKYTQDAVAAGGTLNSDGSVTNANGSITEPNGQVVPANQANNASAGVPASPASVPATAAPAATAQPAATTPAAAPAPAPAPAPVAEAPAPPPAPVVHTAPAGTAVTIRVNQEIAASRDPEGTRFTGVLERPVVSHGHTIFERGTPVAGEVVASKRKGTFKGSGDLSIVLTAIGRDTVHTSEYTLVNKGRGKRTAGFIGGGGGLGALIGGLAGGGKGALIGGLAGAGAGTAASATGSKDVVIRPESVITFRLRESVSH